MAINQGSPWFYYDFPNSQTAQTVGNSSYYHIPAELTVTVPPGQNLLVAQFLNLDGNINNNGRIVGVAIG